MSWGELIRGHCVPCLIPRQGLAPGACIAMVCSWGFELSGGCPRPQVAPGELPSGSSAGTGGDAGPAGEAVAMQMGVAPGEADAAAGLAGLSSSNGAGGSDAAAGEPGGAASVPYARRLLLKSLLRAIALASYAPGTGARPQA